MKDALQGTMFVVFAFPRVWPPKDRFTILRRSLERGTIELMAGHQGELTVQLTSSSGATQSFPFQRVEPESEARTLITVAWDGSGVRFRLNGQELRLDPDRQLPPLTIKAKPEHRPPTVALLYPHLRPETAEREIDVWFLQTVQDIDHRALTANRYQLIRAAGLLRQVLLDDSPLLHQVNGLYRKKIVFEVIEFRSVPPIPPDELWRTLDPSRFPGVEVERVGLDSFLSIPVLLVDGNQVTVKDVIKACANAKGGIHYGEPGNEQEELLIRMDSELELLLVEPSVYLLLGLCRVCLRAFEPLVEAITQA